MSPEHILVLDAAYRAALGSVRDQPGLQAATDAGQVWLRGLPATELLPLALRQLPTRAAYVADTEGRLFPVGKHTPTGRLPLLAWQPLAQLVPLEVPTAALPGQVPPAGTLRLVAATRPRPGTALLTTLAALAQYAETAPAVRLAAWRFAVSGRGQALLLGTPLPPLPGQELWLSEGLLLPAGLESEVPLAARLLAHRLNPSGNAVLLFDAAGEWEFIAAEYLHPVTRAAVRLTAATFAADE
ncbi:MAG: hypothetical protein ACRYFX_23355 [Janthinobacterium lividum]